MTEAEKRLLDYAIGLTPDRMRSVGSSEFAELRQAVHQERLAAVMPGAWEEYAQLKRAAITLEYKATKFASAHLVQADPARVQKIDRELLEEVWK